MSNNDTNPKETALDIALRKAEEYQEQRRQELQQKINARDARPRLPIADRALALDILDEIDAYRRTLAVTKERDNNDYVLRVVAAMIARRAGYPDCMAWRKALSDDPETTYAQDKQDDDFRWSF